MTRTVFIEIITNSHTLIYILPALLLYLCMRVCPSLPLDLRIQMPPPFEQPCLNHLSRLSILLPLSIISSHPIILRSHQRYTRIPCHLTIPLHSTSSSSRAAHTHIRIEEAAPTSHSWQQQLLRDKARYEREKQPMRRRQTERDTKTERRGEMKT